MNFIDLLAVLVSLWLGLRGLRNGLVREGLEAASVLMGVFVAYRLHRPYGEIASIYLGLPAEFLRPVLLFAIAATLTGIGFLFAALCARAVPKEGVAAAIDEAGGFCFGALKGVLFTFLVLGLFAQVPVGFVVAALEGSIAGRAVYTVLPEVYRYVHSLLDAGGIGLP